MENELLDARSIATKIQDKEEEKALLARKHQRLPETPTKNSFGFITPMNVGKEEQAASMAEDQESALPSYSGKVIML